MREGSMDHLEGLRGGGVEGWRGGGGVEGEGWGRGDEG